MCIQSPFHRYAMLVTGPVRIIAFTLLANRMRRVRAQFQIDTDFCNIDGGICQVSNNLKDKCAQKGGADYYECICLSGSVPLDLE